MKHFYKIIIIIMLLSSISIPQNVSLDGKWLMAVDSAGGKDPAQTGSLYWREINVPSSWQSAFDDLRNYQGIGWYKRSFDINNLIPGKIYILTFQAVDYIAEVYINGKEAGIHEGGYTPFSFNITDKIHTGKNEIIVRILDPLYDKPGTEGFLYENIPHGKQTWYVQTSGIWRDVSLEIKPEIYFTQVHITPSNDGKIEITSKLNKALTAKNTFSVIVNSPDGKEILKKILNFPASDENNFRLSIDHPLLWNIDSPNLYSLTFILGDETRTEKFGFRKFESRDKKLYLNDEPFYLIAALDQDFYPETIYTTPSEEYIRDEMTKAKKLGLNMLRCHIKVPDPVYLKVADELGLLVWYEIPNWITFTPETGERASATINAMLERDWNHPSFVIMSLINESWGLDLSKKDQRDWLVTEFDRVKQIAKGRLVVDNSACWGNFHMKTDINDYHTYWSIPENRSNFNKTIQDVASRPAWLFSSYGDAQQTGSEPLLISEFGNWGLPKLTGNDPWWFSNDFLGNQLVLPKGCNDRFAEYKYNRIFNDYNELAENSQYAQLRSLKYEIEEIRLHPEIQGYVITEFTDINWECNGLLDMWRNYKANSNEIPVVQQQDVIIPRTEKYSYTNGENVSVKLYISHYSNKDFKGVEIKWKNSLGQNGSFKIPSVRRSEVIELSPVIFKVNSYSGCSVRTDFEVVKNNTVLAQNFSEVYCYPEIVKQGNIKLRTANNKATWGKFNSALNNYYSLDEKSPLLITNYLDDTILKEMESGTNVLCITDSNTSFPGNFPLKLINRNSEWYDGNWASNFNWKDRDHPIFNGMNKNKYLGFQIDGSIPGQVLTQIPAGNFYDVIAGMYVGWVQLNSAYIFQAKYGEGRIIFCTFPVGDTYTADPFARTLLDNMIKYISGNKFSASYELKM